MPQAAVGALWRARRAVVVGDPLQIEPVFTVPVKLDRSARRSHSKLPQDLRVMPHTVSVQNLADAANPCGALMPAREMNPNGWVVLCGCIAVVSIRCSGSQTPWHTKTR